MSDPYKVLGISRDATDEQIKEAYREMAKKYHPDNYQGSPIADLANEKMKEVNEAYDQITNERKNRKHGGSSSAKGTYNSYQSNYSATGSGFTDVRNLIMAGRIADAELILNGVPLDGRNAEWYFLKGTVLYKRGWMEEAYNHFAKACDMDPSNSEFAAAYNQIKNQRSGVYGGYNPNMQRSQGGCSGCDVCGGLLCADCCCECLGGDLIRCC